MDWMIVLKHLIEYYNENNKRQIRLEIEDMRMIVKMGSRNIFEQAILDEIGGQEEAARTICGDWFCDGINHCNPK